MIPGINPREMQKAMKKLGIRQEEIEADEVIIKSGNKEIVITNPQVTKVNMMGQEMLQVSGELEDYINEDDVKLVMEQAQVSREKAEKALKENNNDIASAILSLKE